jgi:hypothetical protein
MSAQKKMLRKIDLGFVSLELVRSNIVCINCLVEEIVTVEKGIQIIEGIKQLVGDIPHASIINSADLYAPYKEFFKFIMSQRNAEKDHIIARALVSTNPASRIESQNFISFYKPLTPTKLFSTVEDAIDWIEPQFNKAD